MAGGMRLGCLEVTLEIFYGQGFIIVVPNFDVSTTSVQVRGVEILRKPRISSRIACGHKDITGVATTMFPVFPARAPGKPMCCARCVRTEARITAVNPHRVTYKKSEVERLL
jgi:hypothetical protein